jgi:hypothetical protein
MYTEPLADGSLNLKAKQSLVDPLSTLVDVSM